MIKSGIELRVNFLLERHRYTRKTHSNRIHCNITCNLAHSPLIVIGEESKFFSGRGNRYSNVLYLENTDNMKDCNDTSGASKYQGDTATHLIIPVSD